MKPGEIYRDAGIRVSAFVVHHGSIEAAKGCDILVHEFYSQKGWEGRTPEWQRYHAAYHTSALDLGKLAAGVQPKKLVLDHELPMGQTFEQVLSEIRQNSSGEVIYGSDLDVIR